MKTCSKCKNLQSLDNFYSADDTVDKKGSWCKNCFRINSIRTYYQRTEKQKIRNRLLIKQWRAKNKKKLREYSKKSHEKRRFQTLQMYGGKKPICKCCGESEIKFLSFDHINGGGNKHLKEIGGKGSLMGWLIKNNYPAGFQILCHNCNFSKGHYGKCPHKNI